MNTRNKFFTIFLLCVASATGFAQEWNFQQDFTHTTWDNNSNQGTSMKMSGSRAIIGIPLYDYHMAFSNAGAILVLKEDNGVWVEELFAGNPDGSPSDNDYFGHSVDIDGDRMVVGVTGDDEQGNSSGSIYIYEYNTPATSWDPPVKVIAPSTVANDNFGSEVALSGDWLAVSSLGRDLSGFQDVGIIDLFKYEGAMWVHKETIQPPIQQLALIFGYDMDIEGDRLVVSAPNYDGATNENGIVYEYKKDGGDTWTLNATIQPDEQLDNGQFGESISLFGNRLAIGSPEGNIAPHNGGQAYIFDWNGSSWTETQKVTSAESTQYDKFASDVYLSGDRLVCGSTDKDEGGIFNIGVSYVFEKEGALFVQKQKLVAPNTENNQKMGFEVAVNDEFVLSNAPYKNHDGSGHASAGYTYIYKYCKTDATISESVCGSYTSVSGNIYTASGQYNDTIPNVNGCDSVITLNLTVFEPNDTTIIDSIVCPLQTYEFPDGSIIENIQIPLTQYSTLADISGCDSVVKTNISVGPSPNINMVVNNASCGGSNGSVDVTVNGGTIFTYSWNNGADTEDLVDVGANTYYLTATNEFNCSATVAANVNSTELTVSGAVTNNPCSDLTFGSIDLTVSGASGPFTFEWTNGAYTEDISNLTAGVYDVIVTDFNGCTSSGSYEVTQPEEFAFESDITLATCSSSDGEIDLTVSGGNGGNQFDWRNQSDTQVETTEDVTGLSQGLYTLTVTDANGCEGTYQVNVSEVGAPTIVLDSVYDASCLNDGALYTSISTSNGIQSIMWSNTDNTEDITNLTSGDYVITVTDNSGCIGNAIFEVPDAIPTLTQICLVTVDQNTNSNLVVWEKPISTDISSFVVYRESAVGGQYQVVDTVPYADESVLTDSTAFPHIRSWKYKIGTINSCGIESQLSPMHKTVHCAISPGVGSLYNIFWDEYIGFDYTTFEVWRHTATNGWESIQSLAIGNTSYTDTPPETIGLDYYVSVTAPSTCSSSKANDYNSSRSNRAAGVFGPIDTTASIVETELKELKAYPSPFSNQLILESGMEMHSLNVLNALGQVIYSRENLNHKSVIETTSWNKGVYFLRVNTKEGLRTIKVVK